MGNQHSRHKHMGSRNIHHKLTMAWHQLIAFQDSDHSIRICMGTRIHNIRHIHTMAWRQHQVWPQALLIQQQERELQSRPRVSCLWLLSTEDVYASMSTMLPM